MTGQNSLPKLALIIEDDEFVAETLRTAVDVTAIFDRIDSSSTVADARQKLSTHHYQLVIVDQSLADGLGSSLLPLMGALTKSQCGVIFTTGYESDTLLGLLRPYPEIIFLPKPYVIETIVETILKSLKIV